jgi:dTDP-glucose 4,6-dehydratase
MALSVYHRHSGLPVVIVRATNYYGPFQQLFRIIPRTAIYLRMGRKIPLHGGGHAVKSYLYIRDVSEGHRRLMEAGRPGGIYHLSPDSGISIRDLVSKLCEMLGHRFENATESVGERLGQDRAYLIDSSKIRSELSWSPQIRFEEGLSKTLGWVNTHWDSIRALPLDYLHRE